jgi:tripartite ATP-independent transporter DctM subunit
LENLIIGGIGAVFLMILLATGTPVGVSLGVVGTIGFGIIMSPKGALGLLGTLPFGSLSVFSFATIPLFICMGTFISIAGISDDVYKMAHTWLGKFKGGIVMATICANAAFGAACGSTFASAAIFSRMAIPQMVKMGVDKKLAAATVAASATIAAMIPPSITLILYAIITGVPIGKALLAGFIPGILSAFVFMSMIYLRVLKNPSISSKIANFTWKQRIKSLHGVWGIIVLFVLVMGGIYTGFVTPTEAGGIGAFGALIISLLLRKMNFVKFVSALKDAAKITSQVFIIILGGLIFSRFLAVSGVANLIVDWVISFGANKYIILVALILIYIMMGCMLDAPSMMVITLPIVFPLIQSLGFDGIWFGIIVTKVVEIGLITPPLGLNVYIVKGASPVPLKLEEIFRGVSWFIFADLITLTLLIIFPDIALVLPNFLD